MNAPEAVKKVRKKRDTSNQAETNRRTGVVRRERKLLQKEAICSFINKETTPVEVEGRKLVRPIEDVLNELSLITSLVPKTILAIYKKRPDEGYAQIDVESPGFGI